MAKAQNMSLPQSFPCKLFSKPIRMGSTIHGTSLGTEQEEMMVLVLQKKPISPINHLSRLNPCHFRLGCFFFLIKHLTLQVRLYPQKHMAGCQSTGIPHVRPGAEFIYRLHFQWRIFNRENLSKI